jgi:hypothetical protein
MIGGPGSGGSLLDIQNRVCGPVAGKPARRRQPLHRCTVDGGDNTPHLPRRGRGCTVVGGDNTTPSPIPVGPPNRRSRDLGNSYRSCRPRCATRRGPHRRGDAFPHNAPASENDLHPGDTLRPHALPGMHRPRSPRRVLPRGGRGSRKRDVDRVRTFPVCRHREGAGLCPDCLAPTHLPGDLPRRNAADRCTVAPLMEGMTHHTCPSPRQRLHGCQGREHSRSPVPVGSANETGVKRGRDLGIWRGLQMLLAAGEGEAVPHAMWIGEGVPRMRRSGSRRAPTITCAVVTLVTQMTRVTFAGRGVPMPSSRTGQYQASRAFSLTCSTSSRRGCTTTC